MKTIIYLFMVVAIFATSCRTKKETASTTISTTTSSTEVIKIVHGTTFGFCHGYCNKTVTYTASSVVYEQYGRDSIAFPPGSVREVFSKDQFEAIVSKFKWNEWDTLPDNIGCPDCTDRGAEFIEVTTSKGIKRVRFDAGADPHPSLAGVLPKMRVTKRNFDKKLNEPEE